MEENEPPIQKPTKPKDNKIIWIVVAIVILLIIFAIVISIIAAVGLYFWVTAFTTAPSTPTPHYTITASCIGAGQSSNGTLFVYNIGTKTIPANSLNVHVGTTSTALTHSSLTPRNTLTVEAEEIGASLYAGTSGTVWTSGGSAVSFRCKQA